MRRRTDPIPAGPEKAALTIGGSSSRATVHAHSHFFVWAIRVKEKHQAPKPKPQRSSTSQNTKPKKQMSEQSACKSVFEPGAWCFFGAWSLEFGVFCLGAIKRIA